MLGQPVARDSPAGRRAAPVRASRARHRPACRPLRIGDWSRTLRRSDKGIRDPSCPWPGTCPGGAGASVSASSLREFGDRLADDLAHQVDRLVGRAMGAAHRLGDDLVDHLELLEVGRRHLHRLGRVLGLGVVAPQDRGAAFRRDHRVDGILQHVDAVGRGDGERAARAALADDHADQRHAEREAGLDASWRRPRPGRAPRPRCRDRRRACRPGSPPACLKRSASFIRRCALR